MQQRVIGSAYGIHYDSFADDRGRPRMLTAWRFHAALCPSLSTHVRPHCCRFSLENESVVVGSRGSGCEGYRVAKSLQLVQVAALEASAVEAIEVVGPEVGVGLAIAPHVVEDHEHAVRHCHDRLLFASATGEAVELGGEVVARGRGDGPGHRT
jgi:hypothetical protein